jgi:hypothetical protein
VRTVTTPRVSTADSGRRSITDQAKNDIRTYLMRQKNRVLIPQATNFASRRRRTPSRPPLMNFQVVSTKPFSRVTGTQELAQAPEAVGAAFTRHRIL